MDHSLPTLWQKAIHTGVMWLPAVIRKKKMLIQIIWLPAVIRKKKCWFRSFDCQLWLKKCWFWALYCQLWSEQKKRKDSPLHMWLPAMIRKSWSEDFNASCDQKKPILNIWMPGVIGTKKKKILICISVPLIISSSFFLWDLFILLS